MKIKKTYRLSKSAVEQIELIKKEFAYEGYGISDSLIIEMALNEYMKKELGLYRKGVNG